MHIHGASHVHGPHGLSGPHSPRAGQGSHASRPQAVDQLDISAEAAAQRAGDTGATPLLRREATTNFDGSTRIDDLAVGERVHVAGRQPVQGAPREPARPHLGHVFSGCEVSVSA